MRTTVMEGSLSEFDLSSVIQVVSIGRQYTGVELFDEGGNVVGTLHLKSGKILDARSGTLSGLDAVSKLLRGSRRRRFSVYRTEAGTDAKRPVGSVGEVLLKLMEGEAGPTERVAVMEGNLSEFDLMTVLQVISIGRQFTGVEVNDPAGVLMGKIQLKAGRVVSAASGHLNGIDAIRRLLKSPRDCRFIVHRTTEEVGEEHLGSLAQIMMKIADVDAGWDSAESNTQARKAPSMPPHSSPPPILRSVPPVAHPSSRAPAAQESLPALTQIVVEAPPAVSGAVARPPVAHARHERFDDPTGSGFVEKHTSPFGIHLVPATPGEAPVICVTSPKGGAGKTTVALNLGVAFARQGSRVLLVDTDYNGVLMAIKAKARSPAGAYGVITGQASLADAVLKTRLHGLQILPWGEAPGDTTAPPGAWSELFRSARESADIILVDTSAGLRGPSADACAAATHALVVLQAEPAGLRALESHLQRIAALGQPPAQLVGIVLNMLDYRARVSLEVLRDLCGGPSAASVFDVPIARSPAFMEAVARGVPVCRGERANTATIGWVFEMLASSILERLGISTPALDDAPLV
jgi:chromosome partitioning protein